ncbi:hypothetical protein U1839_21140 [Sphingomonas sp. RT2P30]|uniref:hypothetical protein n=1 Tax=Parasphingomonas halimpatiens TaxID=3096162 RepID=UPI002FC72F91
MAAILVLAACKPATTPAAEPTVAVAPVPAFSASDEASIKADAVARLQKRTTGAAIMGTLHSCSEYFSLGIPQIVDSTLGEQAGKVRLLIPIAVFHPEPSGTAPDIGCYGYAHPGWLLNQPYNVTFEFQVERWQTGWRVAEIQANGF